MSCGLSLDQTREGSWHGMPPIVRPLIVGRATTRHRPADETEAQEVETGSLMVSTAEPTSTNGGLADG